MTKWLDEQPHHLVKVVTKGEDGKWLSKKDFEDDPTLAAKFPSQGDVMSVYNDVLNRVKANGKRYTITVTTTGIGIFEFK